jgi:hypothetical protein
MTTRTTPRTGAQSSAAPPGQPSSADGPNGATANYAGVPDWIIKAIQKLGVCFEPGGKNYWVQDARGV